MSWDSWCRVVVGYILQIEIWLDIEVNPVPIVFGVYEIVYLDNSLWMG